MLWKMVSYVARVPSAGRLISMRTVRAISRVVAVPTVGVSPILICAAEGSFFVFAARGARVAFALGVPTSLPLVVALTSGCPASVAKALNTAAWRLPITSLVLSVVRKYPIRSSLLSVQASLPRSSKRAL
jgi:hypothetical protein